LGDGLPSAWGGGTASLLGLVPLSGCGQAAVLAGSPRVWPTYVTRCSALLRPCTLYPAHQEQELGWDPYTMSSQDSGPICKDLHLFFAERVTFCSLLPLLPAFVGGNICIFNGSLSRVHTWDCSYCHEKRTQLFPLGNLWDWLSGESSHGGDSEHERPPLRLGLAGL
jgi:hypothetical protein